MDQFVQKTQEEIIKSKYERWKKDKPPLNIDSGKFIFRTREDVTVEPPQLAPEDVFQQHMAVDSRDKLHNARPDIVLFVNGIPFAVIEPRRRNG